MDLLGPSVGHFWNDIYDGFDIFKELTVRKLDNSEFTDSEIRKIAEELFEDMDEDRYVIGTEIRSKELRFCSVGTYATYNLDEYQQLVEDYFDLFEEKPNVVDVLPGSRELFFHRIDRMLVGVLLIEYSKDIEVTTSLVARFRKDCDKNNANERLIVTDNRIENGIKKLVDSMDIKTKSTDQIIREMNENFLERALDERKLDVRLEKDGQFNLSRFKVLLDYVKNASTNVDKKRSLEDLAEYLLNGIKGFEVVSRNPRGPSEEVDLIVANESDNQFLRRLGNPLLVECRHRKKPTASGDIRDFSGKMKSMAINTAFLFSLKGISGEKYDALSALRDAKKEGNHIIPLDMNDLSQISQGASPITVIRNAFYRFI